MLHDLMRCINLRLLVGCIELSHILSNGSAHRFDSSDRLIYNQVAIQQGKRQNKRIREQPKNHSRHEARPARLQP